MNDDLTLLREYARENSEAAFAELVSRHINLVHSVALRQVRDDHLAAEITQAVFIILARKADSLGDKIILSGWLCRTARYASANALTIQRRRQQREQEAFMQSQIESSAGFQPANETPAETWNEISPLLDGAMEKLGQKDHDALVLRFFEGKSFSEVGTALGAGEAAAKMRVGRALEKLRKFFSKRGVGSTTAIIAGMISANSVHAAPVSLAKIISVVAIAKGATASASTLTLIKGALKIMAWTKMKTAVGVGIFLVAGVSTITVKNNYFPSEPSYQGRRLSEWLLDIDYNQPPDKRAKAGEAVRQMGAKTLPFLIADLADKKSKDNFYSQATLAFDALGSAGKPAIPKLTKLLEQNPGYVPGALAGIGRDALPELLSALTNKSFFVRDNAAANLANVICAGKITSEEAKASFPIAINNLTYDNTNTLFRVNTRWRAAGLLNALKLEPDVSVPALLNCMQESMDETNYTVAASCALALGHFGSDTQSAIPSMIKNMKRLLDEPADMNHIACETQFAMALGNCGRKAQAAIPVLVEASNSTNAVLSQIATQSLKLIQ